MIELADLVPVDPLALVTADRKTWPAPVVAVVDLMQAGDTYSQAILKVASLGDGHVGRLRRAVREAREACSAIALMFLKLEAENVDGWLDEVIDIGDMVELDHVAIAKANLQCNNRFRMAEMRNRDRYAVKPDKVTVNIGTVTGPSFVFVGMGPEDTEDVIDAQCIEETRQ
tara:strand:+ start:324 stop:836 length:513 start_codon:yes stop_codon:yes gene_type:complete